MILSRLFKPSMVITLGAVVVSDMHLPGVPRGPRMACRVERSLTQEADSASFGIHNLSPEIEMAAVAAFHELGKLPITISAGYEGSVSRIFSGDLRTIVPGERSGSDFVLRGTADDGGDVINELTVSMSSAGVSAEVMIEIALAKINTGDPLRKILPYPILPHPSVKVSIAATVPAARTQIFNYVHIGRVSGLLNEAARILGVRWWIADGLLYMARRQLPVDGLAIVVPERAWLTTPKPMGDGLITFDSIFDPNLIPGRVVQIVQGPSKYSIGVGIQTVRCEHVSASVDTRGSETARSSMRLRRTS